MVHDHQTTELLSAYVDGEVDPRQKVAIERLLQRDPQARALLADLRRNREILAGLPRHEAPASILTDIQAFTERAALLDDDDYHGIPDRRTLRVFRRLIPLAMAASLGFAALAGWYFYNNTLPGLKNRSVTPWADGFDAATTTLALAADRPLEEKLAAGLPTELVQAHPFEAEPVRLAITVENESQKQAVLARLDADMFSNSIADITEPDSPAVRNQAAAPQSFYVRGRAGVNHAAGAPTQRLLRAPASQVAVILNDLQGATAETQKVELQAGPLQVVGQQNAVDLLNAVSGENPEAAFARQQLAQNSVLPRSDSPESRLAFRQPKDRSAGDDEDAHPAGRAEITKKDALAKSADTRHEPAAESAATANAPAEIDAKDTVADTSDQRKAGEREARRSRSRGADSAGRDGVRTADSRANTDAPASGETPADAEFLGEFLKNVGIDPEALVAKPHDGDSDHEEMGPPAEPGTLTARRRSELERSVAAGPASAETDASAARAPQPSPARPESTKTASAGAREAAGDMTTEELIAEIETATAGVDEATRFRVNKAVFEASAKPEPYVTMVIEVKTADSPPGARDSAPRAPGQPPANASETRDPRVNGPSSR